MDLADVTQKWKRKNQILFSRQSSCLQDLLQQICLQKHRTLVLWALECAQDLVVCFKNRHPEEERLERAVSLCKEWASGHVKMPQAKSAIMAAHAAAKEYRSPVDIAVCHAVGQGCATVHVETHAIGLPIYELTAVVWEYGIGLCEEAVENKIAQYLTHLCDCERRVDAPENCWASFLMDDTRLNKEKCLMEKRRERER